MSTRNRVERRCPGTLLGVLLLTLTLASNSRSSLAASDLGQRPMRFDIPAQQLPGALLKFSQQSGIQVTSPGQLLEGKQTNGVVGTFLPGDALALLLTDTALIFEVVDGTTVVITGATSGAQRKGLQRVSNSATSALDATGAPPMMLAQATQGASGQGARAPSPAQDLPATQQAAQSEKLAEVVVTGSMIARINGETALPVQVLKREDLQRTGATNVEDLFHGISSASSSGSTVAANATGTLTGAISTISLRGLGSARTLVLINGKRASVYGGGSIGPAGSSVDIGAIPVSAIERVEILKDGASAIYGSDAIAGVVNFILRSNFQGIDASVTGGTPTEHGGGQEERVSAFAGKGDLAQDHYNIGLGLDFEHTNALMGSSRSFASRYNPTYGNDLTSSFAFPANVAVPGKGTRNPLVPQCGPYSLADANFPTQCRFDNSPYDSLEPETKKVSVSLNGHLSVAGSNQLYTEDSFAQLKTTTTVQPVPLSYQNPMIAGDPYIAYLANLLATQYPTYKNPAVTPGTGAFLLPPSSPYYPSAFAASSGITGQPLNLIYRDFANGLRNTEDTANTLRLVVGLKGTAASWDYDTSVLYSEVKVHEDLLSGFPLFSRIMPLLDTGTINPFGVTADPAALAAARASEFTGQDFESRTSVTSLSARASRDLLMLPNGPFSMAAGAEVRRETFKYDPAAAIQTGDIAGQGNQLAESAARNVESAFLEFSADVAKGLELDAAVRYDNYQNIGNTVNPKLSLRYQPAERVLMRAAAGSGFRAPSLTDLYASQAASVTANGTRDPIQCPVFSANNPSCSFQFTTITGGNPNLTPEKSRTYTLGLVFEPVREVSLDLDAFWIDLRNQIVVGGLSYATILQNAQTATQYASFITRNAAGDIVAISQTNANLFKSSVSGLDFDLKYGLSLGQFGRLTLLGDGTYFNRFVTQNSNGTWTNQVDRGLTSFGGVIARFRYAASAVYQVGGWGLSITQYYQKGYHDVPSSVTLVPRDVAPYTLYDAQVFYEGLQSFKFTVGGRNLLNQAPPYANYAGSANNFIGGYDITYGDPRGRFFYGTVTYSFH
jgi:iron complex outermembrane recepter protein